MTAVPADLISVVVYLSVFCIVGSVGNGLVVYVIMYVKEPIVSRHFIITLAVLDIIACVVVMPMTSYYEFLNHAVDSDVMCKIYHFLITSNVPFSVFIMVAIAIERCSAICRPLWRTPPPGPIIALLTAVSLLLGTIVALFFGTVQPAHPTLGEYVSHWMGNQSLEAVNSSDNPARLADHVTPVSADELRRRAALNLTWVVWVGDRLYVNAGACVNTDVLISNTVQWYFHKCYACLYVISLVLIFTFYSLIFHSVLVRQRRKQRYKVKAKSSKASSPPSQRHSAVCLMTGQETQTETTTTDVEMKHYQGQGHGGQASRRDSRKHMKRQKTMSAEVKSAAMLFVITMVFTITYVPAFLMSLDLIPYSRPVFYLYFLNFAINPIIYGFMNKRFRTRLNLICCPASVKAAIRR